MPFSLQLPSRIRQPQSLVDARARGRDEVLRQAGAILAGSVLPFLLVVYLSLEGGGYDAVVRSEVGIAVWWIVLVGAVIGILPGRPINRPGLAGLALLCGFAVWTGIGIAWSESVERSITELARVAALLGVFALALAAQGPEFLRRVVGSVAAAIALVAILALASRLHPSWFPPNEVAEVLPTERARLSYPLTYWNGVATLIAIGISLLLWTATAARHLGIRALSVAALPVLALVAYYTLSRGGVVEAAVGLAVLLALHPRRLTLLPPLLLGAVGAAVLISAASGRAELADGLLTAPALEQGDEMALITFAVCAAIGLLGGGLQIVRRRKLVSMPQIGRDGAIRATLATAITAVAVALALGLPARLSSTWETFKQPITPGADPDRFTSSTGSGRYQWWESAIDASASDRLTGLGPGTFEYWWARGDGAIPGFVRDAHSLYLETLGELGVIGMALIVAFVFGIVGVGIKRALRGRRDLERVELVAAGTAAAATFAAAAAIDWSWEMTVLPVVFLLLGAALLGRSAAPPPAGKAESAASAMAVRTALIGVAVASIVVIAVPMLSERSIRSSKDQVDDGRLLDALESARRAGDLLPPAATPDIQEALILELGGNLPAAADAAREATEDEPTNFRTWLVLSRVEALLGNTAASSEAYREARSLNPRSPLFSG